MPRSGSRGNGTAPEYLEVGSRLRTARLAHGLSLRVLADRLGVSPSLISQVETGRAKPSVSTLYSMSAELGVSLDDLLFPDSGPNGRSVAPAVPPDTAQTATASPQPVSATSIPVGSMPALPVQTAGSRKRIRLASGVVWERLTTASIPNAEFLYVTYEVGGASTHEHEFQRHAGQEWGYIISGTLGVTIGFDDFVLGPGDSISFDSTTPHRMRNLGKEPVHGIWFTLGRSPVDLGGATSSAPAAHADTDGTDEGH